MSDLKFTVVGKAPASKPANKPPPGGLKFKVVGPANRKVSKRKQVIIGIGIAVLVVGLGIALYFLIGRGVSAKDYLGTWKLGNTVILIEEKTEEAHVKKVKETVTLNDGRIATLKKAVWVRGKKGGDLGYMSQGGIYELKNPDGSSEFVLIYYCDTCNQYVIHGLRLTEDGKMEVSLPRRNGVNITTTSQRSHRKSDFNYKADRKWVTYEPTEPVPDKKAKK